MLLHPSRRSVVAGAAVAAASAATAPALNVGRVTRGIVFHDRTGDGRATRDSAGLGGVLVSNGRDIVATTSDGRWSLPSRPGHGVFAIKPQGWVFARDLPGFQHGWQFDTGADDDVAFGLVPSREPAMFEVALLADTQPQSELELDFLRDTVLDDVARSGAAFAINHGDVVFDDLTLYDRYLRLVAGTGMPWHHCPGNHDMNGIGDGVTDRFDVWKRKIGPTHYAFEIGQCTFIVLNNVAPLPPDQPTASGYDYQGRIGADQLAFVRNLLARTPRDRLVVLSMHIPLVGFEAPDDPASHTIDRDALLHLLADRPHTVSFSGHTHTTEHHYLEISGGTRRHHHHVLTAASGSWWSGPFDHRGTPIARSRDGNPRGFHLLSIQGNRYTTRFVANAEMRGSAGQFALCSGSSADRPLLSDGRLTLSRDNLANTTLAFNIFDGGPRTTVQLDLVQRGRSAPLTSVVMQRETIRCPSTAHHFARHRTALKDWVEVAPSSHVWTSPLPASLGAGVYAVTATIHDEYGRQRKSSALIEISET